MKKKLLALVLSCTLTMSLFTACGNTDSTENDTNVTSDQGAETEGSTGADTDAEAVAGTDADTDANTDTDATAKTNTDADADTNAETDTETTALADGDYSAKFDTDSSMFHVNEAMEGRGYLNVVDGKMTIHISLTSKNIVNLFPGTAEDAQKDGAELLQPTVDTVTYSDGMTEEVYGFDVPVEKLDEEFDLALIGTKGVWYDHKVSVSDPLPLED